MASATVTVDLAQLPAVRAILIAAVDLLNEVEATPEDFVAPGIVREADKLRAVCEEWIV